MQKNENIKEDDRYQNESFQAEKMWRRKGLSRDQTENISVGVTTWRQTMKTQRLLAGAKQPMKSSVTKAGCPFCLEAPSSHFPAQEERLNLPGGLQEREGSAVARVGQGEGRSGRAEQAL